MAYFFDPDAISLPAGDDEKRARLALAQGEDGTPRLTLAQPDADLEGLRAAQDADQSREGDMRFARAGEQAAAAMLRRAPDYTGIEPNQQQALKAYLQQRAQTGEAAKQAQAQAHEQRAGEQWSAGHELDLKKYLLEKAAQEREASQGDARLKLEGGRLALDRERLGQEQWAYAANPVTGAAGKFNRKTGQWVAIEGPQGAGGLPPLKPAELESQTRELGKDEEDPAKLIADLEVLKKAAAEAKPDEPIAGFGAVSGRVPDFLVGADGVANRQASLRLMASLLSMQSGKAVSESEAERALKARGLSATATPAAMRAGLASLEKELRGAIANREAKYRPEVRDEYARRGGFTSKRLPAGDDGGPIDLTKPAAPARPADKRPKRTFNGETRVWSGTAWVKE